MRARILVLLLGALAVMGLAATGCSTQTVMETSWELPGYSGGPYHDIAIMGVLKKGESDQAFETELTQEFQAAKVDAVPGFSIVKNPQDMTKEKMQNLVDKSGVDAVLISKLIAVDKNLNYVQPTAFTEPAGPYTDWWSDPYWGYYNPYPYHYWGYWYPATQVVVEPGYWQVDKTFRVQTALYRASDHRLIWTATSRTFDPMSEVDLARSLGSTLLSKLKKAGLIQTS